MKSRLNDLTNVLRRSVEIAARNQPLKSEISIYRIEWQLSQVEQIAATYFYA